MGARLSSISYLRLPRVWPVADLGHSYTDKTDTGWSWFDNSSDDSLLLDKRFER